MPESSQKSGKNQYRSTSASSHTAYATPSRTRPEKPRPNRWATSRHTSAPQPYSAAMNARFQGSRRSSGGDEPERPSPKNGATRRMSRTGLGLTRKLAQSGVVDFETRHASRHFVPVRVGALNLPTS